VSDYRVHGTTGAFSWSGWWWLWDERRFWVIRVRSSDGESRSHVLRILRMWTVNVHEHWMLTSDCPYYTACTRVWTNTF